LAPTLHQFILTNLNSDGTISWQDSFSLETQAEFEFCLYQLFYEGLVATDPHVICRALNPFFISLVVFVLCFLGLSLHFIFATVYTWQSHCSATTTHDAAVLVVMPVLDEGTEALSTTIDSVLESDHPRRCLMVIVDGIMIAKGASETSAELCGKILGFDAKVDHDVCYSYQCAAQQVENYASVYYGTYEKQVRGRVKELPFCVIVKRGIPQERNRYKAGSRGIRDSRLLIAGMLNRIHHRRQPYPLDSMIAKCLYRLDVPAKEFDFLWFVQPEAQVEKSALSQMVHTMVRDPYLVACRGETLVSNPTASWVSMMQSFTNFQQCHLIQASQWGSVSSLPTNLALFRIVDPDTSTVLVHDHVLQAYSLPYTQSLHLQNLLQGNDDHVLANLLLQTFPQSTVRWVPQARCSTPVSFTLRDWLHQQSIQWGIQFHTDWRLLISTRCGRWSNVRLMTSLLIRTLQPAVVVYWGWITVQYFVQQQQNAEVFVAGTGILTAIVVRNLLVLVVNRACWQQVLGWWIYSLLMIPLHWFLLPIYAFWHMDEI